MSARTDHYPALRPLVAALEKADIVRALAAEYQGLKAKKLLARELECIHDATRKGHW